MFQIPAKEKVSRLDRCNNVCVISISERTLVHSVSFYRDDTGMFGKGPGYGVALRKVGKIQQKIEGWEVCICFLTTWVS